MKTTFLDPNDEQPPWMTASEWKKTQKVKRRAAGSSSVKEKLQKRRESKAATDLRLASVGLILPKMNMAEIRGARTVQRAVRCLYARKKLKVLQMEAEEKKTKLIKAAITLQTAVQKWKVNFNTNKLGIEDTTESLQDDITEESNKEQQSDTEPGSSQPAEAEITDEVAISLINVDTIKAVEDSYDTTNNQKSTTGAVIQGGRDQNAVSDHQMYAMKDDEEHITAALQDDITEESNKEQQSDTEPGSSQQVAVVGDNEPSSNRNILLSPLKSSDNDNYSAATLKSFQEKLKAFKAQDISNCPDKHGLTTTLVPAGGYSCSVCNKSLDVGSESHECRLCDYDVCGQCKKGSVVRTSSSWKAARKRQMVQEQKARAQAGRAEISAAKLERRVEKKRAQESRKTAKAQAKDAKIKARASKEALRKSQVFREEKRKESKVSDIIVSNCPGRHGLKISVTPSSDFVCCSQCSERLQISQLFHGCRECDFDLCESCFRSNIPNAGAPAIEASIAEQSMETSNHWKWLGILFASRSRRRQDLQKSSLEKLEALRSKLGVSISNTPREP